MRLGDGRGERRDRAFVPLLELGLSVWLVINILGNFYKSLINKFLCKHNFKIIDK